MRETLHMVHDDKGNFRETVLGDAPSSAEVSLNAKGQAQFSIKFYFDSAERLVEDVDESMIAAIRKVKAALEFEHIPLAGTPESEARR